MCAKSSTFLSTGLGTYSCLRREGRDRLEDAIDGVLDEVADDMLIVGPVLVEDPSEKMVPSFVVVLDSFEALETREVLEALEGASEVTDIAYLPPPATDEVVLSSSALLNLLASICSISRVMFDMVWSSPVVLKDS